MTKLADLLNDPANIEGLSPDAIPQLRGELAALDTMLLSRLLSAGKEQTPGGNQLIDVAEAALRLGVSQDYLYRNHVRLPFTRRVGRKLLFSANGIEKYISQKRT